MDQREVIQEVLDIVEEYFEAMGPDDFNPINEDRASKMADYLSDRILGYWEIFEPIFRAALDAPPAG